MKNLEKEIEMLKGEISEIKQMLKKPEKTPVVKTRNTKMNSNELEELKLWAKETGNEQGVMNYCGFFKSLDTNGDREANWGTTHCTAGELLGLPREKVSTVFAALGNRQRLEILLNILEKPTTVAQLTSDLNLNTSGMAYHHLKSLISADLVEEVQGAEKGTYAVKGHRVQGIILALAGVGDLIDNYYSEGNW